MIKNPWHNMMDSSQRRAESSIKHNIFWIIDLKGNYGFYIQTTDPFDDLNNLPKLKGISVLKRNSNKCNGELFLILNQKDDWQIFYALCEDLLAVTRLYNEENKMINAVEIRLKRWQELLKLDTSSKLTLEKQMGLFAELLCLKEFIIPKKGIQQAVISWVGPEFDKQDFLLDYSAIEVKSFRVSKGLIINISSLQQLHSEKENLFLLAYGLTPSDKGISISDVIEDIKELHKNANTETFDLFENKLKDYGYIPELINEPLQKFLSNTPKAYLVDNSFPKINPKDINSSIISVKYSIDLAQCEKFEIPLLSLIKKG